jgi:Cu-processing system permease protein
VWLLYVLIYDMALLGLLVVDQGRIISGGVLNALLLANPTDAYRLLNLGAGNISALSGMGGVAENVALSPGVLIGALLLWVAVPLSAAALAFSRREL